MTITSKIPAQRLYSLIEDLTTTETNAIKTLTPDGANGVVWTDLSPTTISNKIIIEDLSDLPTPISDVITLDTNGITYQFVGVVDIGVNTIIVTASNVKFIGLNPATDGLSSTTSGVVITANNGFNIQDIQLIGFGASNLIKCVGTGVEFYSSERMTYLGGTSQVDVTDFDTVAINFGLHQLCTNAVMLHGNFKSYIHTNCLFRDVSGVGIDLGTAISDAIGLNLCTCVNTATTTFISMLVDSGNLIPTGEGTITNCKIDTTAGGSASVGYSPLDLLWYAAGNRSILTSDRVLFSGWEIAFDGLITIPTQAISTTAVKILIDADGANSNEAYLPTAIRGIDHLWDTTSNCVKGIVVGDSLDMRLQVVPTAFAGNPNELTLVIDIGGDVTPTIIVAQDTKAVKGITEPLIFSFPLFTLDTFITNGGQLFLKTDTGTVTIGGRSIFLVRTSSGAS